MERLGLWAVEGDSAQRRTAPQQQGGPSAAGGGGGGGGAGAGAGGSTSSGYEDFDAFKSSFERRGVGALEMLSAEMKMQGMYVV
jgi:hypothetical protein